jgi:hypothetical protein
MSRRSIEELIEKLSDLQLEQEQTLRELRQQVRRSAERQQETKAPAPPPPAVVVSDDFQVGDRVIITNKINHALRGEPGTNRIGVVNKVTAERVHLVTLAGTHTCRARKNLKLYEPNELSF